MYLLTPLSLRKRLSTSVYLYCSKANSSSCSYVKGDVPGAQLKLTKVSKGGNNILAVTRADKNVRRSGRK